MIQFNLLPDVKKEYIKARRQKRMITTVAVFASGTAIGITVILFLFVQVAQQKNITDLTNDINSQIAAIESTPELEKILTVQQQNRSLPSLHENNPYTSRLFDYLSVTTPASISISSINVDVENSTMTIEGSAATIADINQYIDTLKFATFKTEDIEEGEPFTSVASELGRSEETAFYTVNLVYDPILFDNTVTVQIVVPNKITTRSSLGAPSLDLFQEQPTTDGGGQ